MSGIAIVDRRPVGNLLTVIASTFWATDTPPTPANAEVDNLAVPPASKLAPRVATLAARSIERRNRARAPQTHSTASIDIASAKSRQREALEAFVERLTRIEQDPQSTATAARIADTERICGAIHRRLGQDKPCVMLIATSAGTAAGLLVLSPPRRPSSRRQQSYPIEIEFLVTAPETKGFGRTLVERASRESRETYECGGRLAAKPLQGAIPFYEALGFVKVADGPLMQYEPRALAEQGFGMGGGRTYSIPA